MDKLTEDMFRGLAQQGEWSELAVRLQEYFDSEPDIATTLDTRRFVAELLDKAQAGEAVFGPALARVDELRQMLKSIDAAEHKLQEIKQKQSLRNQLDNM